MIVYLSWGTKDIYDDHKQGGGLLWPAFVL